MHIRYMLQVPSLRTASLGAVLQRLSPSLGQQVSNVEHVECGGTKLTDLRSV